MKKLCSLALVLALVLSLSVPAFAEGTSEKVNQTGDTEIAVTGTYQAGTGGGTVFSIDISWENMSFTYKGADKDTWDPDNYQYINSGKQAGWGESSGTITVTNHSNAFLTLGCDYDANNGFEDATMKFEYNHCEFEHQDRGLVGSAETGDAQTTTITVNPDGSLPANTSGAQIGTITLTIGEWEEPEPEDVKTFASTFRGDLSNFGDIVPDNDEYYSAACSAVEKLETAIAEISEPQTREQLAAIVNAYIEASGAMTTLRNKYSEQES